MIGITLLATSTYIKFIPDLVASIRKHAKFKHQIHLFTDCEEDVKGVIKHYVPHAPWPEITLHKFRIFSENENLWRGYSHMLFCDADMIWVGDVYAKDIMTTGILACDHPWLHDQPRRRFTYERRWQSCAFVPDNKGVKYYAGAIFGGATLPLIEHAKRIKSGVAHDDLNGITAVWHDESHHNKLLAVNKPTKILPVSFCYDPKNGTPEDPKIMCDNDDSLKVR